MINVHKKYFRYIWEIFSRAWLVIDFVGKIEIEN